MARRPVPRPELPRRCAPAQPHQRRSKSRAASRWTRPSAAARPILGVLPQANAPSADKAFVDWQHDVTTRDLALATREGFQSIEHVKRYTTTGMATDQGKTSNLNAMAIVAKSLDVSIPQVGLTTFRMPYTPVTFGSMAGISRGDLFDPVRTTPTHAWAEAKGAVFENVALWKRARYFPRAGEDMHAAVARECRAVRSRMRHIRRLDARQDRSRRPRCRRIHEPAVRQQLVQFGRRPLALRDTAPRRRLHFRRWRGGAHRPGSLPRDHHHRRRAARARLDGGLSAKPNGRTSRCGSPRPRNNGPSLPCKARTRGECSSRCSRESISAPRLGRT